MICRCFGRTLDFSLVRRTAEAALGVPDYDAYVAHLARVHPEREAPAREVFLRERQAARYGGVLRCC